MKFSRTNKWPPVPYGIQSALFSHSFLHHSSFKCLYVSLFNAAHVKTIQYKVEYITCGRISQKCWLVTCWLQMVTGMYNTNYQKLVRSHYSLFQYAIYDTDMYLEQRDILGRKKKQQFNIIFFVCMCSHLSHGRVCSCRSILIK